MENVELSPAVIRFAAMNMLAMREHSAKELEQKLMQKFAHSQWVAEVIRKLCDDGLQSDIRFTEAFIKMRKHQGKGPLLVRLELKERGISSELVASSMNVSDEVWNHIARKVYLKKFGHHTAVDIKLMAKQKRFLTARGFSSYNIDYALNNTD